MTEQPRKNTKTHLAIAIAQGVQVAAWAHANEVCRRKAFRWAKDPLVRKMVEAYRRRTIDQAIGLMTKQTTRAAEIIIAIAEEAASDSVRLRAARALFSDTMTVSKFSDMEVRMTELETRLDQKTAAKNSAVATWSPTTYSQVANPAAMRPGTSIATGAG